MDLASKAHFGSDNPADYNPANFGWGAVDPEQNSSLLKVFTFNGVSFGLMHRDVHGLFTGLLGELVPKIPGGLVPGTCGCYNPKSVTVGGDRSFHTYAIAIDINWSANPMYAQSRPTGPHALPEVSGQIARRWGCEWGGDWVSPKDWMHIECHLSPADARAVTAGATIEGDDEDMLTDQQIKQIAAEVWAFDLQNKHVVDKDGKMISATAGQNLTNANRFANAAAANTAGLDENALLAAISKQGVTINQAQIKAALEEVLGSVKLTTD